MVGGAHCDSAVEYSAPQSPHILSGSVKENILYVYKKKYVAWILLASALETLELAGEVAGGEGDDGCRLEGL